MARSLKITRHFSLSSHKKCDKPLVTYDVEPPLENNNNKLVPNKEIELQDRLAELKNDHIKTDSMVRLYTKDKISSELSTSLTDQTYPSGLAASQQASPSGTLTGETHFERWTTDTTLKEISSWSVKAQDPKDRTKSPEIGYPYEYPYPIPKTKKIMHWESEAFMMYHEETETQVGKHYTNDLHHIEADKNNPSTSNFMIAFLFALSFGFMIVRLGYLLIVDAPEGGFNYDRKTPMKVSLTGEIVPR